MSSTCFELEGSSSGRRMCLQLWYGTVHFTCIGISSLVGRRVCNPLFYLLVLLEPSGSKYVEDIKIKNYNINLENVHFVGVAQLL